ncbi:MAG: sensor histidine kinase [Clostridia bacterium]|nr:sensor histidine kinase [Clostridia bacterium]
MKFKKGQRSISLSAITVLSVTLAAITAVSVCVSIFAGVYSRSLLRDARVSSLQAAEQTATAVDNYLDSMKEKLSLIYGIVLKTETPVELEEKLSAVTYVQNDIFSITLYGENGEIIACAGSGGELKNNISADESFDKELYEKTDGFILTSSHVQTLFKNEYPWVVTIAVKTEKPIFDKGVYIAIDFKFSEIAKYINSVGVGRQGYCFITDKKGDIVYHPQQQMLFSGIKSENLELLTAKPDGVINDSDVIYALKTTENGEWRTAAVTYTGELKTERQTQIIISVALTFLICALILLIVLIVYSNIVNKPVKSLIKDMKRFEKEADGFVLNGGSEAVTELRVISDSFRHMTVKISELMEKVRHEETELRKTELKALQAQINPHFLYNTLDSIQWMCEQGRTDDAAKMVSSLARLFRISISRGKELITIKDEMRHAESYLIIQSYRYKDQFTYSFEIDPTLENCLCNKITVQPLIENAIYHGLNRTVDEGEIKISVKKAPDDENDILITVSDNGIGMTEEQCNAILKKERSDSSGIGVKNVNDRLKIYFGDKYGLNIESELDVGTTVTVRIPKKENE